MNMTSMNRSSSRTLFHQEAPPTNHQQGNNTQPPRFQSIDRKLLPQILGKQGIEVSPSFFDNPKREEVRNFLDDIISLVFGPQVVLRDSKSIQLAIEANMARSTHNRNGNTRSNLNEAARSSA